MSQKSYENWPQEGFFVIIFTLLWRLALRLLSAGLKIFANLKVRNYNSDVNKTYMTYVPPYNFSFPKMRVTMMGQARCASKKPSKNAMKLTKF